MLRKSLAFFLSSTLILTGCGNQASNNVIPHTAAAIVTTTPSAAIKHVVVIFGENISFDHYFATYPKAANLSSNKSQFTAAAGTPVPAGLSGDLLTANPNKLNPVNGAGATNPFRLDITQAATASQDHNYGPEQKAFNNGKMDSFPLSVGTPDSAALATATGASQISTTNGLTMGYYDGNTVTAMWNYAQNYALNDHSFGTNFGPSTVGAINLISGQTNGVAQHDADAIAKGAVVADGNGGLTVIGDPDPEGDICTSTEVVSMSGKNIGDLLNSANVTWGFFEGGFDLTLTNSNGTVGCHRTSKGISPGPYPDYIPHHQPFQYYASTANLNHVRPTPKVPIGAADNGGANHQYDIHDFTDALAAGDLPSVSFLKAPGIQDGHAGYSNPLDEQTFIVNTVNAIEKSPFWSSTAIILAYDDSDGWYDHLSNIVNGSATTLDALNGPGVCGSATSSSAAALPGVNPATLHAQGRCGYGPRLPLLVISPWAKKNFVDSTVTDQSSILRFIEDTFLSGQRIGQGSFDSIASPLTNMFDFSNGAAPPNPKPIILDPSTGLVVSGS